jgi:hypothetical protein
MSEKDIPQFGVEDLLLRLTTEFGYGPQIAKDTANDLLDSSPAIKLAFWHWWQTSELDNSLEIDGYTVERLIREHGMNPVGAFVTLDWLRRDPQQALSALKRGHDSPTFRRPSTT